MINDNAKKEMADMPSELFQVEGQLAEEDILLLEEQSGIGSYRSASGEIEKPFRAKSYFSIGDPLVYPLAELLKKRGDKVPADIRLQMQQYEFWQINLACSFQTAPGCRFHDARFELVLQTSPGVTTTPAQTTTDKAIAYDLFPLRVEDERKITVKRSLKPEVTFKFDPASASVALPVYERSEEYINYTGRIAAFDLQGTRPSWSFSRTKSHEIEGPQRLFMILRKPRGMEVKATFTLAARIQFMLGKVALDPTPLVMLFRRRNPQSIITDPTVVLC